MKRAFLLLLVAGLAGCTNIEKRPDGSWSYNSFFNKKSIKELEVGSDGSIKMKGYSSAQSDNIEAVARGVSEGLKTK